MWKLSFTRGNPVLAVTLLLFFMIFSKHDSVLPRTWNSLCNNRLLKVDLSPLWINDSSVSVYWWSWSNNKGCVCLKCTITHNKYIWYSNTHWDVTSADLATGLCGTCLLQVLTCCHELCSYRSKGRLFESQVTSNYRGSEWEMLS